MKEGIKKDKILLVVSGTGKFPKSNKYDFMTVEEALKELLDAVKEIKNPSK